MGEVKDGECQGMKEEGQIGRKQKVWKGRNERDRYGKRKEARKREICYIECNCTMMAEIIPALMTTRTKMMK